MEISKCLPDPDVYKQRRDTYLVKLANTHSTGTRSAREPKTYKRAVKVIRFGSTDFRIAPLPDESQSAIEAQS
jgi:hypothetical protein